MIHPTYEGNSSLHSTYGLLALKNLQTQLSKKPIHHVLEGGVFW